MEADTESKRSGLPREETLSLESNDLEDLDKEEESEEEEEEQVDNSHEQETSAKKQLFPDPANQQQETKEGTAAQLTQVQETVQELKEMFKSAQETLSSVSYGDQILEEKVNNNRIQCEQQLADVVQMVLTLKSEFGVLVGQLQQALNKQKLLQRHVDLLQCERDMLLEELERSGAISHSLSKKYHSGQSRPNGLTRANDTHLSVLLERAHRVFSDSPVRPPSEHDSGVTTYQHGEASSCGEVTPPNVSPMMQSFIDGLPNGLKVEPVLDYDSDSSLTVAANKSLDMSRSLEDHCAHTIQVDSSEDEEEGELKTSPHHNRGVEEEVVTPSPEQTSQNAANIQFKHSTSPHSVAPHERNSRDAQRTWVAREILETERTYCSGLWTILDHFAKPIKQANLLSHKELNTVFPPCLSQIYDLHCQLLLDLENRLANLKWHCLVGDIFAKFVDSQGELMQLYQTYAKELPLTFRQIDKSYKQSLRFRKFLKKSQAAPCCNNLKLASFLLTPIQRIPRYGLLLKQILHHTNEDHPDHYHLKVSTQRVTVFLNQLNNSIEHCMNMVPIACTPRQKRKHRLRSSFRSSSMSSYDGMQVLQRDNSILSNGGEGQSSRMLNLSALRDRLINRHNSTAANTSIMSIPDRNYQQNAATSTTGLHDERHNLTFNGSVADCTTEIYTNDGNMTLPTGGRKRKPPAPRRPVSAGVLGQSQVVRQVQKRPSTADSSSSRIDSRPPRPRSLTEQLSDSSFHSQQSCGFMGTQNINIMSNNNSEHHSSPPHQTSHKHLESSHSSPQSFSEIPSVKSLPNVSHEGSPPDYGIYGDKDDIMENRMYEPAAISPRQQGVEGGYMLRGKRLGVTSRSKSQGSLLMQDGSASPSQQHITLALAASLSSEDYLPKLHSEPDISTAVSNEDVGSNNHHAGMVSHQAYSDLNAANTTTWEEVAAETALNTAINRHRPGHRWRKKKDKQRKALGSNGDLDMTTDKKKGSLKDSIKNLFFKKRTSKVIDLASEDSNPSSLLDLPMVVADLHTPGVTSDMREGDHDVEKEVSPPVSPHREQAPPREETVLLPGVAPDLETFEDENGVPVSAV